MRKWAKTLSTRTGPISLFLCKYWGLITQIMPCIEQKAIHIKNRKWLKFPIVFFMIDVTCISICVILNLFLGGEMWIMDKILFIYYANNNKIESIGVFFIELHIIIHHLFMQNFFLLRACIIIKVCIILNYTVYIKLDCSNIVKLRYLKCDGTV